MSRAWTELKRRQFGAMAACILCLVASELAFAQPSGDQVQTVIAALKQGNYAEALKLTRAGLAQSPSSAQLLTLRAMAFSGQGNSAESLRAFQRALQASPNYLPALEGTSQLLYKEHSQKAVPFLEQIVRLRPTDSVAHAMLGSLAFLRGDCGTAAEQFEASPDQLEAQPSAKLEYASCLTQLNKSDQGIAVLQSMLAADPGNGSARQAMAMIQLKAGQPREAMETLGPLLQSPNLDASTARLAAAVYEANRDTPHAVQILRDAIVRDPRNVDLYVDFANMAFTHQSFQAGVEMVNFGLKAVPGSAALYLARGVLSVQLAHYEEAEADFEKAQQLDPQQGFTAAARGLLAARGQSATPQNLSELHRRLEKTPNDAFLWSLEASLLEEGAPQPGTPEYAEAMHAAKKAVALQPTLASGYDVLAKLYQQAGNTNESIQQCRNALKYDPKDQTALYHLIMTLRKTDQKSEVPELLKRLAELRQEATQKEAEDNRYKLMIEPDSSTDANKVGEHN